MNQLDIDLARRLAAERDAQRRAEQQRRRMLPAKERRPLPAFGQVLARLIPARLVPRRRLG
jgi:hypothetical protein